MSRVLLALVVSVLLTTPVPDVSQQRRLQLPGRSVIATKYAQLGGEQGFLGRPATEERPTPDGAGRYRHFQNGSIYWHPSTGAHEVRGLIRQRWAELGWERSFLGYPTSDELPLANGAGRYSEFQGGAIYWTAGTDIVEVRKKGEPPPAMAGRPATNTATAIGRGTRATAEGGRATVADVGPSLLLVPPKDPGPLGKGSAAGSLNGVPWNAYPSCSGSSIPQPVQDVLALLGQIAGAFGAKVAPPDYRCGTYTRELATGVTLGVPPATPGGQPAWGFLGGRGDLMADATLCLLKDIGDRPGGRIENFASVPVGIGKVELRQIVGLSKFDPAAKRAELYQITKICAPLLGCIDAGRQAITATVRESAPAWPGGMRSGDHPIRNSYALELATDWSATRFGATLPPIVIITPYGQVSAQPKFDYSANLLPIDTPFSYPKGGKVEFHYPNAMKLATPIIDDTYGRSGIPFILNVVTHLPPPPVEAPTGQPSGGIQIGQAKPDSRPFGWSSQLGFGGRDGAYDAAVWKGAGAMPPFRPDFDFGKARSQLEARPAANFVAQAPIRFEPPNPLSLLPGAVQSIVSGVELWVEVNPRFAADYAAQFALLSREGISTNGCNLSGEFGGTCGIAESTVGLQANAQGRIDIIGTVHLKISFISFGLYTPPTIDVTKSFTIPLPSPDRVWDPARIENVQEAHNSSKVGWAIHAASTPATADWQGMKGLSGMQSSNLRQWTQACLATPPKNPTPPPPPFYEPGKSDDLTPELLPCNICVADSRQNKYDPFKVFQVDTRKPGLPASVCEWEQNAGCYDMCSWNGSNWIQVEQSAVDVVGKQCSLPKPPVIK